MFDSTRVFVTVFAVILVILGAWFAFGNASPQVVSPTATSTPQATTTPPVPAPAQSQTIEVGIGQTASAFGVSITPKEVVEDSRCPSDVQCIQAGRVRVRADLVSGMGTASQVFLVGETITTEAEAVTLVEVKPATKISTVALKPSDYRFVFKIEKRAIMYVNASSDLIRVTTPPPGAVTGKEFKVMGQARGNWFFEASFPIEVLDKDGKKIAVGIAQAQGEWMTTNFVPFSADIKIPDSYIGPATLVLHKDNPSGEARFDASASYGITIEY